MAIRTDGTHDQHEFETRSLMTHDLVHFAVESEAKARGGFYGTLAEGGLAPPDWLTGDFMRCVLERLRQLQGQWRATPFGQTMELRFEV